MKSTPAGWPRISSCIFYDDPAAAIDWLCRAFGFEVRLKVEGEGGSIEHSELVFGEGLIMVEGTQRRDPGREGYQAKHISPRAVDGRNTQTLCVFVDDVDAHCARARASGAQVFREPNTQDYGEEYWADRSYGALDPEGHQWWFMQRMRDPRPSGS
jgi:uncharacterized glyoxalase superfamily protein PhnB